MASSVIRLFGSMVEVRLFQNNLLKKYVKSRFMMMMYEKIIIFAASYTKPTVGVEDKGNILNGVYLTLFSRRVEISQLSFMSENIATVDAYGIFLWAALAVL